jgi:hypothetical protein
MLFGATPNNKTLGKSGLTVNDNRLAIIEQQLSIWIIRNRQRGASECATKWISQGIEKGEFDTASEQQRDCRAAWTNQAGVVFQKEEFYQRNNPTS